MKRVAGKIIGRVFSRRARLGDGLESIDPRNLLSVERRLQAAIEALERQGVPARELIDQRDDGRLVIEQVIHLDGHEPDSPLGLQALICHHCCALKAWAAALPGHEGSIERRLHHAYQLGRFTTLADAYRIQDESQATFRKRGADQVRKYTAADKANWRELRKTKYAHHSENRAAELIAEACGLPTSAKASVRAALREKPDMPL